MARGNCYHICTSEDSINEISADTLYDLDPEGHHDYIGFDDDLQEVDEFISTLTRANVCVSNFIKTDHGPCYEITVKPAEQLRDAKCCYFESRFRKLQNLSRTMTLIDFAEGDSKVFVEFTKTLHDRFGDAVVIDNGLGLTFKTLDTWVRSLTPNERFYLSTAYVFMK